MAHKRINNCFSFSLDVPTHKGQVSLLSKTHMYWQVVAHSSIHAGAICEKHRESWSLNPDCFVANKSHPLLDCQGSFRRSCFQATAVHTIQISCFSLVVVVVVVVVVWCFIICFIICPLPRRSQLFWD